MENIISQRITQLRRAAWGGGGEGGRERGGEVVNVEIDLGLSAWANAREYFERKKVAAEKVSSPASLSNPRYSTRASCVFVMVLS